MADAISQARSHLLKIGFVRDCRADPRSGQPAAMRWGAMVLETRADYGVLNFVKHRREAKATNLD